MELSVYLIDGQNKKNKEQKLFNYPAIISIIFIVLVNNKLGKP